MLNTSALALVCKIASNMNIPRNYTFELISDFQNFLTATILQGFDQHLKPYVSKEHLLNVDYFVQICRDPFRSVKTEYRLNSVLEKDDLITDLISFDINPKSQIKNEDENDSKYKGILMPFAFQFKKFFELPQVFELTQKHAEEVSKDENISHFINAEVWKEKLESYELNDTINSVSFNIDETQINNALGSHVCMYNIYLAVI